MSSELMRYISIHHKMPSGRPLNLGRLHGGWNRIMVHFISPLE